MQKLLCVCVCEREREREREGSIHLAATSKVSGLQRKRSCKVKGFVEKDFGSREKKKIDVDEICLAHDPSAYLTR